MVRNTVLPHNETQIGHYILPAWQVLLLFRPFFHFKSKKRRRDYLFSRLDKTSPAPITEQELLVETHLFDIIGGPL